MNIFQILNTLLPTSAHKYSTNPFVNKVFVKSLDTPTKDWVFLATNGHQACIAKLQGMPELTKCYAFSKDEHFELSKACEKLAKAIGVTKSDETPEGLVLSTGEASITLQPEDLPFDLQSVVDKLKVNPKTEFRIDISYVEQAAKVFKKLFTEKHLDITSYEDCIHMEQKKDTFNVEYVIMKVLKD